MDLRHLLWGFEEGIKTVISSLSGHSRGESGGMLRVVDDGHPGGIFLLILIIKRIKITLLYSTNTYKNRRGGVTERVRLPFKV